MFNQIIKTLEHLPIPTKNMLEESKVLPIIQRWSQTKTAVPQLSEGDGYSSENTSRAHTPLNTPDPSIKLSTEVDTETPKKLMFRRLKIISENSMDSAISDVTSELECKDGKEDLDQLETVTVEDDDDLQSQQLCESKVESETSIEGSKLPASEPEADVEAELKESSGTKLEETIAEETQSQDEEEGVSDVESERSQEPHDKTVDISDLATKLLDSWKDLKVRNQFFSFLSMSLIILNQTAANLNKLTASLAISISEKWTVISQVVRFNDKCLQCSEAISRLSPLSLTGKSTSYW